MQLVFYKVLLSVYYAQKINKTLIGRKFRLAITEMMKYDEIDEMHRL